MKYLRGHTKYGIQMNIKFRLIDKTSKCIFQVENLHKRAKCKAAGLNYDIQLQSSCL